MRVFCFACRTLLAEEGEERKPGPCPKCGVELTVSYQRGQEFRLVAGGFSIQSRRPSGGRWEAKSQSKHSFFISENRNHFVERVIDRLGNEYHERIIDEETGEVVREIHEPLTSHRGRGSARIKRDTKK